MNLPKNRAEAGVTVFEGDFGRRKPEQLVEMDKMPKKETIFGKIFKKAKQEENRRMKQYESSCESFTEESFDKLKYYKKVTSMPKFSSSMGHRTLQQNCVDKNVKKVRRAPTFIVQSNPE